MDMSLSKLQEFVDGQGGLLCCSPWGCKELDMTKQLNRTEMGFVTAFLPRNKCLLIPWCSYHLQWFWVQLNKVCHSFHFFPIYLPGSDGTDAMILVFWMLNFKPAFSLYSFTFIKRLFSSSLLSAIRVVSSIYLRLLIFQLYVYIYPLPLESPSHAPHSLIPPL